MSPHLRLSLVMLAVLMCRARAEALPLDPSPAEGLAESHDHWDHIVRRRSISSMFETHEQDETSHIVDIQEYYRQSFDQGWDTHDQELMRLLKVLERVTAQGGSTAQDRASIQDETSHLLEVKVDSKPIQGRYIVMLQSDTDDYTLDRTIQVLSKANRDSNQRIRASDIQALRNLKGFVGTLNSKTLALLQRHPLVAHIEADMAVRRSQVAVPVEKETGVAESDSAVTWNLDRLDQHTNKLDGVYKPEGTGKNVDLYIIDTGVMASHQELVGRVQYAGYDAVDDLTGTQNHGEDCNGHGTHCAGTAAGTTLGVAREATIYNLRALNCKGTGAVSGIVKGIDRIIAQHKNEPTGRPKVISQSLGVKTSVSLNRAIVEATNAGIVMVGAAGNQAGNACEHSPASAKVGIAVGATDQADKVSMFTNTGPCTDIMAPGMSIKSASISCSTCTKTMSGTSMAAPHAAGYAAILRSLHPQLSAAEVKEKMMKQSTKNHIKLSAAISSRNIGETPDRLLYVAKANAPDSDIDIETAQSQWFPK